MKDFKKLLIWEKSHQLTLRIYETTKTFPSFELYGLTSQLRRAVSSIPTNIAEGCGKNSDKDFGRYLSIAAGSASEVQYLLILTRDLKYLESTIIDQLEQDVIEIKKMLYSLIEKITES